MDGKIWPASQRGLAVTDESGPWLSESGPPRLQLSEVTMAYEKRDLSERLIQFSAAVVRLLNELPGTMPAKKIADQVMRSATSVGANFEEARGSESRADFCHKLGVALKEMRETRYWLCLIEAAEMVEDKSKMAKIVDEASQLRAILGKSLATAKGTAKNSGTKSSEL